MWRAAQSKADGTELELKKDSIFERDLVRAGRSRFRVKSFAMPGVEPGAIVEYRWREIDHRARSLYIRAQFQREFPVQKRQLLFCPTIEAIYGIPHVDSPIPLQTSALARRTAMVSNPLTLENMPAFHEEPMMPGEPNVRSWGLVFYSDGAHREPEKYWANVGKDQYNRYLKPAMKANNEIKDAAATATSDAKSGRREGSCADPLYPEEPARFV